MLTDLCYNAVKLDRYHPHFPKEETEPQRSEGISLRLPNKWWIQTRTLQGQALSTSPHCPPLTLCVKGFSKAGNSQSCECWHVHNVLGPICRLAHYLRLCRYRGDAWVCPIWIFRDTGTQQITQLPRAEVWAGNAVLQ